MTRDSKEEVSVKTTSTARITRIYVDSDADPIYIPFPEPTSTSPNTIRRKSGGDGKGEASVKATSTTRVARIYVHVNADPIYIPFPEPTSTSPNTEEWTLDELDDEKPDEGESTE